MISPSFILNVSMMCLDSIEEHQLKESRLENKFHLDSSMGSHSFMNKCCFPSVPGQRS